MIVRVLHSSMPGLAVFCTSQPWICDVLQQTANLSCITKKATCKCNHVIRGSWNWGGSCGPCGSCGITELAAQTTTAGWHSQWSALIFLHGGCSRSLEPSHWGGYYHLDEFPTASGSQDLSCEWLPPCLSGMWRRGVPSGESQTQLYLSYTSPCVQPRCWGLESILAPDLAVRGYHASM